MDILQKLFGSALRVSLLRMFFMAPEGMFTMAEVREKSGADATFVRRELTMLSAIGFIKEREASKQKKKPKTWSYNASFVYADPLRRLVLSALCLDHADIVSHFKGKGTIRLVVLSGVFLDEPHTQSRADIVVVGDNLKRTAIESAIRSIEKQIGRELTYSVLTTKDFKYRVDMRDKFIRDVLDFPHKKIINKLGA